MSSTAKHTITLAEAIARHNRDHPGKGTLVDITPALEVACSARLRSLLTKRCTSPEERAIVDRLTVPRSERAEYIALLCVAASGVWVRAQRGSWEEVQGFVEGTGNPDSRQRAGKDIRRAMRLVSRLVKTGCVVRKEVNFCNHSHH